MLAGKPAITVEIPSPRILNEELVASSLLGSRNALARAGLIDAPIEPEALKEAILGACGDVDPLESPDIKGRREAVNRLTGFTLQERERFKQRLLQVTADDLTRVSSSYLAAGRGVQATVAGAELIAAAQKEHPGLFEVVAPV